MTYWRTLNLAVSQPYKILPFLIAATLYGKNMHMESILFQLIEAPFKTCLPLR